MVGFRLIIGAIITIFISFGGIVSDDYSLSASNVASNIKVSYDNSVSSQAFSTISIFALEMFLKGIHPI